MPVAFNEVRECLNCRRCGPVNVHGRCPTCGSDAVIPLPPVQQIGTLCSLRIRYRPATEIETPQPSGVSR
jgi:hypothetical protein